ncbi:MAG TPA: pectinesterase family protein [Thermoanaerobaculia bacterium]
MLLLFAVTSLLPDTMAAATLVNDTFADANSQNQDLASNSVRLFQGRTGTVRTDSPGMVMFDMTAAGGSEGFWAYFTDGAPVALNVGDRLTVSATFVLQGFAANGQDLRFGLFDSKGTRNTANTTGGLNSSAFTDDTGYALAFFASGTGSPFALYRRTTVPGATGILNAFTDFTPIAGSGASARQTLQNDTPYALTLTVERLTATQTRLSVSVTGGTLSGLNYSGVETSNTPNTTFDWFGFRVSGPTFATRMGFTNWRAEYRPAPPVITAQPQPSNLTVQVGSTVTMSVGATGTELTYQWLRNGAPITDNPSATSPTLTITDAQVDDSGTYTAVVSNAGGSVTSDAVNLTVSTEPVAPPPAITAQPVDTTVTIGSPATLSVAASGEGLFYQWYKNGAVIAGATSSSLTFPSAQVGDAGVYTVVVGNSGGTVTSAPARLTVVSAMTATAFSPPNGATNLNIDVPLTITFDQTPRVGTSGRIRIFNAADNTLVDTIDVAVDTNTGVHAPGPQSARSIGGSSWLFNYHPILISGNTAVLYPSRTLAYGQTYYVTIEPGAVTDVNGAPFAGFTDPFVWRFSTKASGPVAGATSIVVAADGSGDFNTVQAAIDFVPTGNTQRVTITVRPGTYMEIVYVRSNKPFITVRGDDRNLSVVGYPNNENLNTGTSPRAAFGVDAPDFTLENITIHNTTTRFNSENRTRQAEAFRGNNDRILLNRVNLLSFQDTLLLQSQTNQGGFVNESYIEGDIDFIWGAGTVYLRNTEVRMLNSSTYYTQIRNPANKNGNVFVNCRLTAAPGVTGGWLTRIDPDQFPYSQVVFIDTVMGAHIRPEGWRLDDNERNGFLNPLTQAGYPNVRLWEYNSVDENGNRVDVSLRHPISRQLTAEEAAFWRNPANVLGGWVPNLGAADISLTGLNQTYTGQPLGVSVITDPPNLATRVTYNGSETRPVNAGSYAVVATIVEPGYSGSTTGTLVIAKATATVTLGNLTHNADGTVKSATVTTDPPGLPVTITYNGSPDAPSAPGTYQVVATVNDPNYQGTATGTLTITDATPPVIRSLTANPSTISPPNGRMIPVTITADVIDNADTTPTTRIISVTSNQNITGDFNITGPLTVELRAERDGGRSRIYTITVESRDDAGNVSTGTVTVTVP